MTAVKSEPVKYKFTYRSKYYKDMDLINLQELAKACLVEKQKSLVNKMMSFDKSFHNPCNISS